jgi:rsbT co-antagonist protein RsbR
VLVLPLVGQIDPRRASQIMETLLEGISAQVADVVIIDITGVPVVDTQVANYLIQAARAARLLGAKIVLVGIGPEIAQTIIQLGVDLSDITTRANLESGISYALSLQGFTIAPAPTLEQER